MSVDLWHKNKTFSYQMAFRMRIKEFNATGIAVLHFGRTASMQRIFYVFIVYEWETENLVHN